MTSIEEAEALGKAAGDDPAKSWQDNPYPFTDSQIMCVTQSPEWYAWRRGFERGSETAKRVSAMGCILMPVDEPASQQAEIERLRKVLLDAERIFGQLARITSNPMNYKDAVDAVNQRSQSGETMCRDALIPPKK